MAAEGDPDSPRSGGGDADDWEELGAFMDAWAERWEQEFRRFSAAQDEYLSRAAGHGLRIGSGLNAAGQDGDEYRSALEEALQDGDEHARRRAGVAGLCSRVEHDRQVEGVRSDAARDRSSRYHEALESANDLVRNITENTAARRRDREAKRREERQAAQRRRAEQRAQRDAAGADAEGGSSASGSGGAGARRSSEPPRFTRVPGSGGAAPAGAAPMLPATFKAYDAAWRDLEQRLAAATGRGCVLQLSFGDVPWPTLLPTVSGILAAESPRERKEKLRTAVLRWHPDKWGPVLEQIREADRGMVMDQVKAVTRRIFEERKNLKS